MSRPDETPATPNPLTRLLRGGAWVIGGTLVANGCALVTSIIAARSLGQDAFGQFGLLRSTFLFLSVFGGASLSLAATKRVAELRATDPDRAGQIIVLLQELAAVLGLTVALLIALLAEPIATHLLGEPLLAESLRLGAVWLAATVVGSVQNGALAGLEAFPTLAKINALDAGLQMIFVCIGLYGGLTNAVGGMALGAMLMLYVRVFVLKLAAKRVGVRLHYSEENLSKTESGKQNHWVNYTNNLKHEWPLLRHFALPAALLGLAVQPFEWCVRLMLSRAPGGFAELGIFTSAYALSQAVQFLPQQLGQSALPVLTRELQSPDRASVRQLTRRLALLFTGSAGVVAVAVAVLAEPLMRLYGARFDIGAIALAVMALAYVFASSTRVSSLILVAGGQMWKQTTHSLVWGAVLAGAFWLAPEKNAASLAVCYVLAFVVFRVLQTNSARKILAANSTPETKAP